MEVLRKGQGVVGLAIRGDVKLGLDMGIVEIGGGGIDEAGGFD